MNKILKALGLNEDIFSIYEDDIEFFEENEFEQLAEYKNENWSKGDDYTIACLTEDNELFFVYVDAHSLTIYVFEELSCFEHEDYIINLMPDLYENYNVALEQINDFTDKNFIACDDGSIINEEGNFEVENFDLIWESDFIDNYGGGRNRIFFNEDTEELLVYSNKNGYEGLYDDLDDAFSSIYDSDIANEVLKVNKDEYFEFSFSDLTLHEIDNEYKVTVGVPLSDAYNPEAIVIDIETEECYTVKTIYGEELEEVLREEDIIFDTLYVGSANGETFWIEKEIVEQELGSDYDMEDIESFDWGDDKKWTCFGFMSFSDSENYIICGIEDSAFNDICKEEDLV